MRSGYMQAHVSYLTEECQACLLLLTTDRDIFSALSEARQKIVEVSTIHSNHSKIQRYIKNLNKILISEITKKFNT